MRVKAERCGDGYRCTISPAPGMYIGADGDDPLHALHGASGLAEKLARVLKKHPELKAVMPPQVELALKAVRIAAWAARSGRLREVAHRMAPATKMVVRRILKAVL